MSTLSGDISTIMTNVQTAANFVLTQINDASAKALNAEFIKIVSPDVPQPLEPGDAKENDDIYQFLDDAIDSAKEAFGELATFSELLSDIDKSAKEDAYDRHISAVAPYQTSIRETMSGLPTYDAPRVTDVASKIGGLAAAPTLLSEVALPDFARSAFSKQMGVRSGLLLNQLVAAANNEVQQTTAQTTTALDAIAMKRAPALVDKVTEGNRVVLESRVSSVMPNVLLSPDKLLKTWEEMAGTRINIGSKVPIELGSTKLEIKRDFAKKVAGEFYRVAKDLADFAIEMIALQERVLSEDRIIQARIQQGIAAAVADVAAAGYSAVRTNFVLSEKAFV